MAKATKTADKFHDLLVDIIDKALGGRPISVGGEYERILQSQERIGWRAMLQGYWPIERQSAYQNTYQTPPKETQKDRNKQTIAMALWQKRMIQTIYQQMICLWKLRNDEQHG
jgi:hypothetical protein